MQGSIQTSFSEAVVAEHAEIGRKPVAHIVVNYRTIGGQPALANFIVEADPNDSELVVHHGSLMDGSGRWNLPEFVLNKTIKQAQTLFHSHFGRPLPDRFITFSDDVHNVVQTDRLLTASRVPIS